MRYVNTIRRIVALSNAIERIPLDEEKYDDIFWKLEDKKESLSNELKRYMHCANRTDEKQRRICYNRIKQVKLAFRLMKIDYYKLFR